MRTLTTLLIAAFAYFLFVGLNAPRGEMGNILDFITSHPLPEESWIQGVVLFVPAALFILLVVLYTKNKDMKTSNRIMQRDLQTFQAALGLLGVAQPNVAISPVYIPGETNPGEELHALETELGESEQRVNRLDALRGSSGGLLEKLAALRTRQLALRVRLETSRTETQTVENETQSLRRLRDEIAESLRQLEDQDGNDLAEEVTSLEESLGELNKSLASAQTQAGRLNTLEAKLEALQLQLAPLTDKTTGVDATYNAVKDELKEKGEELDGINSGVDNDDVADDIDSMEEEMDELMEAIGKAEKNFQRLLDLKKTLAEKLAPKPEVPPAPAS